MKAHWTLLQLIVITGLLLAVTHTPTFIERFGSLLKVSSQSAPQPLPSAARTRTRFDRSLPFSQTNRPPANWYPYPNNSLWTQRIPADAPLHDIKPANYGLLASSSTMVNCALTGCGTYSINDPFGAMRSFIVSTTADGSPSQNDQGKPIYYSQPGDPYYRVRWQSNDDCYYDSTKQGSPAVDFVVQIPDEAGWPGASGTDTYLGGYDQSQGIIFSMARTGEQTLFKLPHCASTDAKKPCDLTGKVGSSCAAARVNLDKDWGWSPGLYSATISGVKMTLGGPGDNLSQGAVGYLGLTRFEELMDGIFHAASSNIGCVNGQVFPATSGAFQCSRLNLPPAQANNYPPNGALLYCDYTDAQIASMNLPPWQNVMLTWLCHYGTYPSITDATKHGVWPISGDAIESELPYFLATKQHHPIFAWLQGQQLGSPNPTSPVPQVTMDCGGNNRKPQSAYRCSYNVLYGIPPLGPGDTLLQHFHIADPCIVKRMANAVGGNYLDAC